MAAGIHCRVEDLTLHVFSVNDDSSVKFVNVENFLSNLMSTILKPVNNYIPMAQPVVSNNNSRNTIQLRMKAIAMWDLLRKRIKLAAILKRPLRKKKHRKVTAYLNYCYLLLQYPAPPQIAC